MSLTPKEKEWNLEIERRKKKVVEEELNLKAELSNIQSLIIFSDIFRILRQSNKLSDQVTKRRKLRLKKRAQYFLGKKLLTEPLKDLEDNTPDIKSKPEKEMIHVEVHSRSRLPKPPQEILETYRRFLKR